MTFLLVRNQAWADSFQLVPLPQLSVLEITGIKDICTEGCSLVFQTVHVLKCFKNWQKISNRVCKTEHIHNECPRRIPWWSTSKECQCWPSWCLLTASSQTKGRSRWELLLTGAGCSKWPSSCLQSAGKWILLVPSQLLQTWLPGSRCTLFITGKLEDSLGSSGAYPCRAMVGWVLHSPVYVGLLTAVLATQHKNCYWKDSFFLTLIIRLGQMNSINKE